MPVSFPAAPATENVFGLTAQNLKYWRRAKANVKAGAANARVLFVGDSTTVGINAAGTWITPNITANLAAALNGQGLATTDNGISGGSVLGATTGSRAGTDPRLSLGSWAAVNPGDYTLGGALFSVTSGTTPLQFTPTAAVDTFNVMWQAFGSNGSFSLQAGTGTATTIPASQTGGNTITTVTGTLGVIPLKATYISGGTCYLQSIEAYNSAVKSVNIMNAGYWGSVSAAWASTSQSYSPLPTLGKWAPDLTIIVPGINDWSYSTAISTFTANVQAIITKAKLSGDVILMTPTPDNTNQSIQPNYIAAIYQLAAANNCVLIDNYARWVSYTVSNPLGFYSDGLHPTSIGYADQAATLAKILMTA